MNFNFFTKNQPYLKKLFISSFIVSLMSLYIYNHSENFPSLAAEDDFFFYLKIASNFINLGFITFDGINYTNGVHPFYFLFISSFVYILSFFGQFNNELIFLYYSIFYSLIIFLICSWLVDIEKVPFLFCLMFMSGFYMEATFLGIMIGIFYLKRNNFIIFLMIITRIDALIIILPVLFLTWKESRKEFLKKIIFLFAGITLLVFFNYFSAGTLISISSLNKLTMESTILERLMFNFSSEVLILKLSFSSFIAFFAFRSLIYKKDKIGLSLLFGTILFTLIHLLFSFFRDWYLAPLLIFSTFIFLRDFSGNFIQDKRSIFLLFGAFVMLAGMSFHDFFYMRDKDVFKSLILELKNKDNEIGFKVDASGYSSFFSNQKIINGDGLVNSYEFYEFKSSNKLKEFFLINEYPDYIIKGTGQKNENFLKEKHYFFYDKKYCLSWSSKKGKKHRFSIYDACK